jgi:endonuclease/exonuclease/phosphatase family metal-dependent hydrolase
MVVHTKSKGIFKVVDMIHWQRENIKNRRKLYGECTRIRQRIDEWFSKGHQIIVMGDINDGPGMDAFEFQFARSAVEILMGDLFDPDRVLRNYAGRPKWGNYGWEPSSARFKDRITEDNINVLIDHILVSANVKPSGQDPHKIWNPFRLEDAKPLKQQLLDASDHFPVTLRIT